LNYAAAVGEIKMKTNFVKLLTITAFVLTAFALMSLHTGMTPVASAKQEDAATMYKTKCAACHTAKAEKFFDPAKTDDEHINTILKGKKGEKPPFMPAFEAKGITPEQAKSLAEYMKSLRTPAS
jgi:mono/diheme cytochrome c family protein